MKYSRHNGVNRILHCFLTRETTYDTLVQFCLFLKFKKNGVSGDTAFVSQTYGTKNHTETYINYKLFGEEFKLITNVYSMFATRFLAFSML